MIKRFLATALAVVFAGCCALVGLSSPAMAAVTNPACSNLPVVNGSTTYNECSYGNGTNIWLEHMDWGWDYTGLAPHPFAVDPLTGDQIVNVFSLPAITFAAPQHVIVDPQTGANAAPTLTNQQATLAADQAIQANTTRPGTGTVALMTTPTATVGSAQPAGVIGTRVYLPTSSDAITYTVEAASVCGVSAPATSVAVTGPTVIDENLQGTVLCAVSITGAPRVRGY